MSLARLAAPVDWLFPPSCPGCGAAGAAPCPECVAALRPAGLIAVDGVDAAVALIWFEGPGARLIRGIKYANHRDALVPLAHALADLVTWRPDVVTWVPTSGRRRRQRGYDQAELLARAVAGRLGVPCRGLLDRTDPGSQTRRNREERQASIGFVARRPAPRSVLMVDDVCTTGASLSAAGAALRAVGAVELGAATLAATP